MPHRRVEDARAALADSVVPGLMVHAGIAKTGEALEDRAHATTDYQRTRGLGLRWWLSRHHPAKQRRFPGPVRASEQQVFAGRQIDRRGGKPAGHGGLSRHDGDTTSTLDGSKRQLEIIRTRATNLALLELLQPLVVVAGPAHGRCRCSIREELLGLRFSLGQSDAALGDGHALVAVRPHGALRRLLIGVELLVSGTGLSLGDEIVAVGAGASVHTGEPAGSAGCGEGLPRNDVEVVDDGCHVVDEGSVVAGHQERPGSLLQQVDEESDGFVVEVVGRLIEDQHARLRQERRSQLQPPGLTGRQRRHGPRAMLAGELGEPEAGEGFVDAGVERPEVEGGHLRQQLVVFGRQRWSRIGSRQFCRHEIEPFADVADAGE